MAVEGLITLASRFDPEETMQRLDAEIRARGMTVFARINHATLAADAGMELRPTEVILFGNPRGGTPLMQASQTIGIDLPLKALVWQDGAGKTLLSYTDPIWLARRHEAKGVDPFVAKLSQTLTELAQKATS